MKKITFLFMAFCAQSSFALVDLLGGPQNIAPYFNSEVKAEALINSFDDLEKPSCIVDELKKSDFLYKNQLTGLVLTSGEPRLRLDGNNVTIRFHGKNLVTQKDQRDLFDIVCRFKP